MTESRIEFLWKAANSLNSENYAALRSNLLARCHDYARHEVNLPKKLFSVSSMCQKCFTPWRFGQYKCILKPERKQIKKLKKKKLCKNKTSSNDTQNTLKNQLVLFCNVCKNKNVQVLHKPLKLKPQVEESTPCIKKRKKKKDKFAGLSEKAVLSAGPKHDLDKNIMRNKKRLSFSNEEHKNTTEVSVNATPKSNETPMVSRPIFKSEVSSANLGNIVVTKKSKKQKKNSAVAKLENKKQSKTNNSIKVLAEILKKSKSTDNNSRLKQLLKSV